MCKRILVAVFITIIIPLLIHYLKINENKLHALEEKVKSVISSAEEYGKIALNKINKHCPNKALDDLKAMFKKNGKVDSTIFSCIIKYLTDEDGFEHLKELLLLPIIEETQVLLSSIINSELGQVIVFNIIELETFKTFTDNNGNFDFEKLITLLEQHSSKNWDFETISSKIVQTVTDIYPKLKGSLLPLQDNLNKMLQKHGFPKDVVFDVDHLLDSLSAIIDYGLEDSLGYPVTSKQYAKPTVFFLKRLYNILQYTKYFSDKKHNPKRLTNNLEEPVATVFKAFEFVEQNTELCKDFMCNFKKSIANITEDFPQIRTLLKAVGLVGCWFISNCTDIPIRTLYAYLTEDANCQEGKIKVTTEYEQSSLPLVY